MAVGALRAWCDGAVYDIGSVPGATIAKPIVVANGSVMATIDIRAAGKVKFFRVRLSAAAGNALSLRVFKNFAPTAILVTFGVLDTEKSDDVNVVAVAKGDLLEVAIAGGTLNDGIVCRAALGVFPP